MRKNHHGKKDRLVKRVFALCLALAVICTCLVPVFATEGLIDPQVNQEASRPVDDGVASYPDDECAGFGEEEATRPVDGGEAAGFGEEEASRPVDDEGGEDNLDGGPSVKETEWGTVIDYGTSTDTSSSTETQWSGEDDVVEKPDDKVVVSGDEIKKLQDMVVYRFWLKELNANDLQDITAQAQINNMTESEYLARNGEVLWNLYFIQAVPRAETIADYSSYIENPSSNRDPKGELRLFDYWYTLDEFGNRVRLNLTDPTSNILDDKTTTVNVYAAWKDGTVGSDEEEDVDHEDLVDKNPVPVDLETKAAASYEDEDGNPKTTTLPVEVKNLPSAAHSLSVIHMGDDDMERFYESHEDSFGEMMPILGLKISPKNAKGETVQPAKGQKATVTVSGLDKLPEMEGATADTLKVLHQTSDGNVEILDVLTYTNGTLTFETSSFSPFVVVRTDGYDTELLDERAANTRTINLGTINVGETQSVRGYYSNRYSSDHSWTSNNENVATVSGEKGEATITGVGKGTATITHKYYYKNKFDLLNKPGYYYDTWTVTVKDWKEEAGLYILYDPEKEPDSNDTSMWTSVVTVSNQHAKLGDLTGATWTNNKNIFLGNIGGADGTTAQQYIKYWPDEAVYNGPRTLNPGDPFRQTHVTYNKGASSDTLEDMILKMYKGKLVEMYKKNGFTEDAANALVEKMKASDITFTITPHKISQSNSTTPDKHIDCTVTVTCDKTFNAKFNVKKPGESGYTTVNSKLYLWKDNDVNTVAQYVNNNTVPYEILEKDGSKWVFDGWYPENADGTGPNLDDSDAHPISNWPYKVSENELTNNGGDRVVNFYAHYKKATSNVTITKHVTGLMGDTHKDFAFRITGLEGKGVTLENNNGGLSNFTLTHNGSVTLKNVPMGTVFAVVETLGVDSGYETKATGYDTAVTDADRTFYYKLVLKDGQQVLMACDANGNNEKEQNELAITVTNHCTLKPDTGVLLDTLPYIVILAVVAGGVALLMLRKHRKEDD